MMLEDELRLWNEHGFSFTDNKVKFYIVELVTKSSLLNPNLHYSPPILPDHLDPHYAFLGDHLPQPQTFQHPLRTPRHHRLWPLPRIPLYRPLPSLHTPMGLSYEFIAALNGPFLTNDTVDTATYSAPDVFVVNNYSFGVNLFGDLLWKAENSLDVLSQIMDTQLVVSQDAIVGEGVLDLLRVVTLLFPTSVR